MFYIIKDWKILSSSSSEISQDWIKSVEIDFTKEELEKINKWCLYENWKIVETPEYLENIKEEEIQKIYEEFENTIKQITAWYTQAEIDTWATKVEEAKKVIAGGTSDLLSSLLLEWENLLDFAKKILQKAKEYSEIYYKAEKTKREKLKNIT